jgi:hypothetical protein
MAQAGLLETAGALTLKSESDEELIVEVHGQDEVREMKREVSVCRREQKSR